MAKIGVVVVFYNQERYIKNCLNSIANQSFKNFVCICVDDHSSDSTFDILSEFVKKDSRFIALQNERNYGSPCHSRNVGIESLKEVEYFMFVDGDDILHPQALEISYEIMKKNPCDFVSFELSLFHSKEELTSFDKVDISNLKIEKYTEPLNTFLTKSKKIAKGNVCNKLYTYKKYKDFRFYEDIFYEDDYMYSLQILSATNSHVTIDCPLYFCRRHDTNITGSLKSHRYLLDVSARMRHTHEYFIEGNNIPVGMEEIFKENMAIDAYRMIVSKTIRKTKDKDELKKLIPIAQKEIRYLIENRYIDTSYLNIGKRASLKCFLSGKIKIAKVLAKIFG